MIGEKIWVDDMKIAPEGFRWCKDYNQAIATINYFSTCEDGIELICLDHDLGSNKTGYDIAKYIVENKIPIKKFYCQSMNPVGRKNIEELLIHYGYQKYF